MNQFALITTRYIAIKVTFSLLIICFAGCSRDYKEIAGDWTILKSEYDGRQKVQSTNSIDYWIRFNTDRTGVIWFRNVGYWPFEYRIKDDAIAFMTPGSTNAGLQPFSINDEFLIFRSQRVTTYFVRIDRQELIGMPISTNTPRGAIAHRLLSGKNDENKVGNEPTINSEEERMKNNNSNPTPPSNPKHDKQSIHKDEGIEVDGEDLMRDVGEEDNN